MLKVANLSVKDREALFRNTAQKCGMNEAIVEKDAVKQSKIYSTKVQIKKQRFFL